MADPLDAIIAQQAAYYGLTVEQYEQRSAAMAEIADAVSEIDEVDGRL